MKPLLQPLRDLGLAKKCFGMLQLVLGGKGKKIYLLTDGTHTPVDLEYLTENLKFYYPEGFIPSESWIMIERLNWRLTVSNDVIILFNMGAGSGNRIADRYRHGLLHVDHRAEPLDGWNWFFEMINWKHPVVFDKSAVQRRFNAYVESIKLPDDARAYVFGTGSSLSKAINYKWLSGYRIVCNTIVKDAELWHHIKPHFIVAGDALYHFAGNTHATCFRNDLRKRLSECDTMFLYPSMFHNIVKREFMDFEDRLLPVDSGAGASIVRDLAAKLSLPCGGGNNVLNLLLLPLACHLSKDIGLWGFDGRNPNDKESLFWVNSERHSYLEHIPEIHRKHPAFYNHFVPRNDCQKYIRTVHGDKLDTAMLEAERLGWKFQMLHPTWTDTLSKRFNETAAKEMLKF